MPHKLSIVVPGLCGPIADIGGLEDAAGPLVDLLKQLAKDKTQANGYTGQLAGLFGLNSSERLSDAALSLLSYGIDPGDSCWIHADPVNLQADMDRAILSDARTLDIHMDEAEKLVEQINTHFAEDDLSVLMADAGNWFIRQAECSLKTTPLSQAMGRNINHLLPTGEGAAQWQRFLNEAQMLLHMSEVNQRREKRGVAAINSLWLWGEGGLPQKGDTDITQVYANDAVTTGMACLGQIKHSALTDPIALAYAMKNQGHSLVSMQQLDGPCNYGDTPAWLDELLVVVEDWLKPLIKTARSLDAEVDIYPCNGVRYHFSNNKQYNISKLIFWKKDRLQDYVDTQ
jgi:hypothetical protein